MKHPEKLRSVVRWSTWLLVGAAIFVTLSPLEWRPSLANDNIERLGALYVLGLLLGLGYPKALAWVTLGMIAGPALLEVAQSFAPGRHGHLRDVAWKSAGGLLGCASAFLLNRRLGDEKRREPAGDTPAGPLPKTRTDDEKTQGSFPAVERAGPDDPASRSMLRLEETR